jgi:MFS family permease
MEAGPTQALPGARTALALLLAINLFNYIDRQVLAAVEPEIRQELFPDDIDRGKDWTGWLSTAFLVSYMVLSPVFGFLADRTSRWRLVGIGVILWSVASGASGLNWGVNLTAAFWILLATRCFVGVGEAAYGPAAPAMISDLFPLQVRGKVLAWFYFAIPVGSALGYTFGDQITTIMGSWRWPFYLVVPPGLLLGLLCFMMTDPRRGQAEPVRGATKRRFNLTDYQALVRIPSYVLNTMGMTAMTFAMGGIAFWMPDYLKVYEAVNLGPFSPKTFFGGLSALAGMLGTLAGGATGDWLRSRYSGSYFLVSGAAMLTGFPLVLLFMVTPFPLAWIFMFLAVFCLFFNTGPTNTILANVTHPAVRASAFALNIFIIHLLGDAISPPLIGMISRRSNLKVGFGVVSAMMLVGGLFWIWGARYLERDTLRAPESLDNSEPSPT